MQVDKKQVIKNVQGACLAARPTWLDEDQAPILQTLRANPKFYRGPWFDAVEIVRAGRRANTTERAFAQLRLLFEVKVSHAPGKVSHP